MPQPSLDNARWTAVCSRDRSAANAFIYAVRTTNIYCRPGCSSRRPNRDNVVFFNTPGEARKAGFRPCLRCRPDDTPVDPDRAAVEQACRTIESAIRAVPLRELAATSGRSPSHFQRIFKGLVGVTPKQYALAHRSRRLRSNLKESRSVTAAIYDSGYGSSGRAYDRIEDQLGMTPTTYRSGGSGLSIRYATASCSLGTALVATTHRGICAIELADSQEAALHCLRDRFPKACIESDDTIADTVAVVVAFLDAPDGRSLDLPLDIQGTAFQHRVWNALTQIPPGETISYGELAELLGKPGAARSVGSAISKNPIAVAVPCHRVVGSDGSLTGYHWGVERKERLLDRERRKT